jgi:hypothetical protein
MLFLTPSLAILYNLDLVPNCPLAALRVLFLLLRELAACFTLVIFSPLFIAFYSRCSYPYGRMLFTFFSKVLSTVVDLERARLRLRVFFVNMCLAPCLCLLTFPDLVILKRFLALLLVLSLGIVFSFLLLWPRVPAVISFWE